MNIGQASKASGVSAKMIRYYEKVGLVPRVDRTSANYRAFSDQGVDELKFIKRARMLGFSVQEIDRLLKLWRDRGRPSREVKAIALKHVQVLDVRIAEMQAMADTLRQLANACAGDERPHCPILNGLGSAAEP